jgi:2-amino-4-hydroxy-6-hydroxymethyldihydropteridine diphosphokinase
MNLVYLALGSNIGDREGNLRAGIRGLTARSVAVLRCASLYSTEPKEVLDQPWFLNTVVEASTNLAPDELLRVCLDVETELGRIRNLDKGPRTLDIDIIFYANNIIRKPGLTIPHPSFSARRFVLVPLAEVAPDFIDPQSGRNIADLLNVCPDQAAVVLSGKCQ